MPDGMWMLGLLVAGLAGWLTWLTNGQAANTRVLNDQVNKITRIEMTLIAISETAASMLHADDDHLGLDRYIDKMLDKNYELSTEEWQELLVKFEGVMNDLSNPKRVRWYAAVVFHICRGELKLPPDKTKNVI